MNKDQLLFALVAEIKKDPSFMKNVIDGCIYGVLDNNKELSSRLVKCEKTAFMLMNKEMTLLHNDGNFKDILDTFNNSHFISTQKYTIEDIKKLFNVC